MIGSQVKYAAGNEINERNKIMNTGELWSRILITVSKGGMNAFTTKNSAEDPHHEIHPASPARTWGMVVVSLFLGFTTLVVSFGAGSAFENSKGELIAPCVAAALYLAFCQFWVAPRGSREFWAKLPVLVASVAPLLLFVNMPPRTWGIPWVLVSGLLGSVVGTMIAQGVTAPTQRGTPTADSSNRGGRCRNYLLIGFILLIAIAFLVPIGVIPSVLADTSPHINARPVGGFLGVTVLFDLFAALVLGNALWRPSERDPSPKGTLGTTAFLALFLTLVYCFFGIGILVGEFGPGLRISSAVLLLCTVCGFITTALMTVTSVIVDRARLSNLDIISVVGRK
jgi:hypothetical protein